MTPGTENNGNKRRQVGKRAGGGRRRSERPSRRMTSTVPEVTEASYQTPASAFTMSSVEITPMCLWVPGSTTTRCEVP